ncbi:hypothetical protein Y1Q_0013043 [Alligator mississippiensis]|uniref:Uncharacterized protein n=1 Tax=Alligator mississippiensis TaxID=8496 RepID=A0A151N6R9_ALLMI|nr:hypothetical protein Y1Q_0013043 [Alligator mississippiensis]
MAAFCLQNTYEATTTSINLLRTGKAAMRMWSPSLLESSHGKSLLKAIKAVWTEAHSNDMINNKLKPAPMMVCYWSLEINPSVLIPKNSGFRNTCPLYKDAEPDHDLLLNFYLCEISSVNMWF